LSRYRKPALFGRNITFFYSNSTNIAPIANLTAGGERRAQTAQSTY
jgi:hypothetical protein